MKRIRTQNFPVHFEGAFRWRGKGRPLCGKDEPTMNLIGSEEINPYRETSEPVTCPECARLYCKIKNAPWNEVESRTLDDAIYTAVGATPPEHNDNEEVASCE